MFANKKKTKMVNFCVPKISRASQVRPDLRQFTKIFEILISLKIFINDGACYHIYFNDFVQKSWEIKKVLYLFIKNILFNICKIQIFESRFDLLLNPKNATLFWQTTRATHKTI